MGDVSASLFTLQDHEPKALQTAHYNLWIVSPADGITVAVAPRGFGTSRWQLFDQTNNSAEQLEGTPPSGGL
jgi:hypothetical protein